MKESMREKNRRLAERNLEKRPALEQEKQKLAELHAELAKLREQYKSIRGQQGEFRSGFVLHTRFTCVR